ncbi:MAG: HAMP domain-containing protein [Candidatus Riflebacteria bacterium]|nr:HAMP domain-containing protein [Candidatus Riflebacteria bacterium]
MMRLSMSLRYKIGTAFSIIAIIFIGFLSVYQIHALNSDFHNTLKNSIEIFSKTEDIYRSVEKKFSTDDNIELSVAEIASVSEFLNELKNVTPELLNKIDTKIASEITDCLKKIQIYSKRPAFEKSTYFLDFEKSFNSLINDLRESRVNVLTEHKSSIDAINRTAQGRIAVIAMLTVIIGLIMSFFFSQRIKLPVRRLKEVIGRLKDGDYEIPVRNDADDEIGQIFKAVNLMADNILIRDKLKIEHIQLEKRRFSAIVNFIRVPIFLTNSKNKIAFANREALELFRLKWDEIFEAEVPSTPLPRELKEYLTFKSSCTEWPYALPLDIIGDSYAYELKVTCIPVINDKNKIESIISILGTINTLPNGNMPTTKKYQTGKFFVPA